MTQQAAEEAGIVDDVVDGEDSPLARHVTSMTDNVYCVTGLGGLVGAAMGRYSRSRYGLREIIAREFVTADGVLDRDRAAALIDRVINQYGDESVAELESAHICFEEISNLASKVIEDRRIGGSPIERSTRYVTYDKRGADGHWRYVVPPEVKENALLLAQYEETMDSLFATYTRVCSGVLSQLETAHPPRDCAYALRSGALPIKLADCSTDAETKAFMRVHAETLRTRSCDIARGLLPTATRTNVGINGNGRYFTGLLTAMSNSRLLELHALSINARRALDEVIPRYVKRAFMPGDEHVTNSGHLADRISAWCSNWLLCVPGALAISDAYGPMDMGTASTVKLVDDLDPITGERITLDAALAAEIVFPFFPLAGVDPIAHMSLAALRALCMRVPHSALRELFAIVRASRETRRNKLPRGAESGYPITVDFITDWGAYRDLERHRMMTQQRQLITPELGFSVYDGLEEYGGLVCLWATERAVSDSERLHGRLANAISLDVAQYAVLMGHRMRWYAGMNLRQATHLCELRSAPQGHPSYRVVAQQLYGEVCGRYPLASEMLRFVNMEDIAWARAGSAAREAAREMTAVSGA